MENEFLKNLKNAVETGEFNSDAANKINQITELAAKVNLEEASKHLSSLSANAVPVTEEEATLANTEYENYMEKLKKEGAINKQLASIIDIEDMVKLSIIDMMTYLNDISDKYNEDKIEIPEEIYSKIVEIQKKYESILIN